MPTSRNRMIPTFHQRDQGLWRLFVTDLDILGHIDARSKPVLRGGLRRWTE